MIYTYKVVTGKMDINKDVFSALPDYQHEATSIKYLNNMLRDYQESARSRKELSMTGTH